MLAQQRPDLGQFSLAADEGVELLCEVVRRARQRTQRRELAAQARMDQLEQPVGLGQVTQPDDAEVAQRELGRQAIGDALDHGLRQQHLAAMGRAHHARGAIHGRAEVVAVTPLVHTQVQSAAQGQRQHAGRWMADLELQLHGGSHRLGRIIERGMQAVAGCLHHPPGMLLDAAPRQRIVPRQGRADPLGLGLPQSRAAFDVGEQISDGSVGHGGMGSINGPGCYVACANRPMRNIREGGQMRLAGHPAGAAQRGFL
ncbi:MAG: hypothetical protein U5L03_11480 [Burkholderiaceae bacterium]|nr:hypothetical protein [Burkholderiaceae bacterium]